MEKYGKVTVNHGKLVNLHKKKRMYTNIHEASKAMKFHRGWVVVSCSNIIYLNARLSISLERMEKTR